MYGEWYDCLASIPERMDLWIETYKLWLRKHTRLDIHREMTILNIVVYYL